MMFLSCILCFGSVKQKKQHIFKLKDWKTGFYPSSSPSVLSAFITVLDQTRVSVSIKLCSLQDDICMIGQLIFSHCNYRQRSTKYKCGRHTPSSRCLVKSVLTSQWRGGPTGTRAVTQGSRLENCLSQRDFFLCRKGYLGIINIYNTTVH